MQRVVCGLIGPLCSSEARSKWNGIFLSSGLDAFFDFYRTKTQRDLELRLSEMFLLERRGYIIGEPFQQSILPLLDRIDPAAQEAGRVDTVVNENGVLLGTCASDEQKMRLWFDFDVPDSTLVPWSTIARSTRRG